MTLAMLAAAALAAWANGPTYPETAELQQLAGSWSVDEEFPRSHPGSHGTGKMEARLGPGGLSLILDYLSIDGPLKGFSNHEVLSWNQQKGKFQAAWINNFMDGVPFGEGPAEGDEIALYYATEEDGRPLYHRSTIAERRPNSFIAQTFTSTDQSSWKLVIILRYRRVDSTRAGTR